MWRCRARSARRTLTNDTRDITPLERPGAVSSLVYIYIGLMVYTPPGLAVASPPLGGNLHDRG